MEIKKTAMDGTLESSDIQVTVSKGSGINIDIKSDVYERFGKDIEKTIKSVIDDFGITDINVKAVDQGSLDCVIRARTVTAIQRATGDEQPAWEALN